LIYISSNIEVLFPFELQEIVNVNINIEEDILKIFILSFCISVFTIFGVLFKYKISND
jgi:cell division transport system permease protein